MAASALAGAAIAASTSPLLLDRHPERVVAMTIAERSRPNIDEDIQVAGPWHIVHTIDGVRTWEGPLPVRTRTLFFNRPPAGMRLSRIGNKDKKHPVKAESGLSAARQKHTWAFSADSIQIRRALGDGPPTDGEYIMEYSRATERERSLNQSMTDQSVADFVFRSVQVGDTSRHGLLLPAPSEIQFAIQIQQGTMLRFDASVIPPEAAMGAERSDGALIDIIVHAKGETTTVSTLAVDQHIQTHTIDLSGFADTPATLSIKTRPKNNTLLDYVFIAEPTVFIADDQAPQMVLIFIDTLRADSLGMYGYHRDTSPKLDDWAQNSAVFTQARSVAPWTLPSARTMITGTHPERWDKIERLQSRLASTGWATGMVAGNVYLSSNFEMAEGWGTHRCINWPQGSTQIHRGQAFLEAHQNQPSFLLLHLMDMHLPYTEPVQYRSLFVEDTPEAIDRTGYFLRKEVTRVARREGAKAKAYFRGRYDNNLRYLDDQIHAFIGGLKDDAIVMIVSDHGEEFWEHGSFEHGHSLYDELLRIPMILKGPGVSPGRFDAPTSLLDVAPTLAAMAGIDTAGMVGFDLRNLANGSATQRFEDRPQAFGRPLYGLRRWGSLENGKKYMADKGNEALYDLAVDPGETQDRSAKHSDELMAARLALGRALDRPYVPVWRLVLNTAKQGAAVRVKLNTPIATAWVGDDPTMRGKAKVDIDPTQTIARWPKQRGMVEVFVVPPTPLPHSFELELKVGSRTETHKIDLSEPPEHKAGSAVTLFKTRLAGRSFRMTTGWAPIPSELDGAIQGFDSEVAGDLESLGYIDKKSEN